MFRLFIVWKYGDGDDGVDGCCETSMAQPTETMAHASQFPRPARRR